MRVLCLLISALFPVVSLVAQTRASANIYGAYRFCHFGCVTIRLNRDQTFDYVLDGDLWNDQRYKGTWKFIGKNRVKAKINETPLQLTVEEGVASPGNKIEVEVTDHVGAILPGAELVGESETGPFKVTTSDEGKAILPQCDSIQLKVLGKTVVYKLRNPLTASLAIQIGPDGFGDPIIDDVWLVKGSQLFIVGEDGSLSSPHRRISRKSERTMFPR